MLIKKIVCEFPVFIIIIFKLIITQKKIKTFIFSSLLRKRQDKNDLLNTLIEQNSLPETNHEVYDWNKIFENCVYTHTHTDTTHIKSCTDHNNPAVCLSILSESIKGIRANGNYNNYCDYYKTMNHYEFFALSYLFRTRFSDENFTVRKDNIIFVVV